MQLNITGQHIDVTDSLRAYVTEKISRLEHHFSNIVSAHVVLDVVKNNHTADASLNIAGGGKAIAASATEPDLYAAIDLLIDKLDRQVIRHKEILQNHHRG